MVKLVVRSYLTHFELYATHILLNLLSPLQAIILLFAVLAASADAVPYDFDDGEGGHYKYLQISSSISLSEPRSSDVGFEMEDGKRRTFG